MNNKCPHCDGTGEADPVDAKTLAKWRADAEIWARKAKKKLRERGGRDLPLGFDPDDDHQYIFKLPD